MSRHLSESRIKRIKGLRGSNASISDLGIVIPEHYAFLLSKWITCYEWLLSESRIERIKGLHGNNASISDLGFVIPEHPARSLSRR